MIALKAVRGFHLGNERVQVAGLPVKTVRAAATGPERRSDPNGSYPVGQLYVQHFQLHQPQARYPLLFWHGGGLTGACWEDTPDGRPGWHLHFMQRGYDTLVSDAVERGRAGWARYPEINPLEPEHRTVEQAWEQFRFGPEGGYVPGAPQQRGFPGQRFPVGSMEQFARQFVARWTNSTPATLRAYETLVRHAGPCVIIAHSQGGYFALEAARRLPDLVKALILLEPVAAPGPGGALGSRYKAIPHLVIWGDYYSESPIWRQYRAGVQRYLDNMAAEGGCVSTMDLPSMGIHGNSHMLMMDDNSDQLATMVHDWLAEAGCYRQ